MKFFTPLLLLAASIGLFFMFITPEYKAITDVRSQTQDYDAAVARAKLVVAKRDNLLAKENSFNPADISRLKTFLPDSIDPIRLIIEMSSMASKSGFDISGVKVTEEGAKASVTPGQDGPMLGSDLVSFSLTATYDQFQNYLTLLEHSLRLIDVATISFTPSDTSATNVYSVGVRTYFLK